MTCYDLCIDNFFLLWRLTFLRSFNISNWAKAVSRMKRGIAFPEGWFDSSLILVQHTDPSSEGANMWSFLTPFTFPVWAMIGVAVFATGIMYWMLERLNSKADEAKLENKPLSTIFLSALTFTGHFDFQPNTHSARILSFSWTFFTLVTVSAYTANLASFLVARRTPDFKIRSIQQAVRYRVPVCIHGSSSQDELITEMYSDVQLVRKRFERDVFEGLKNGDCRVAIAPVNSYEIYVRSSTMNADCSIQSEKRVIEIISAGLATAVDSGTLCTSLIDNVIDLHLSEMIADRFIERLWNAHLQKAGDTACLAEGDIPGASNSLVTDADEETVSLTLEEMSGIFILHGMFAAIALTIALIRFFLVKKKSRRDMLQQLGLSDKGSSRDVNACQTSHQSQKDTSTTSDMQYSVPPPRIFAPNEYWIRDREMRNRINNGL